ncbi:MAG: xanthine dehydrogenase family protein molybdopterin-binding subunit [Xanthobacteraceae bacterium]|nr:xanthine dehydrogenase family protein molybdopterin-binding subunit [Xanthobacteraceae bacterium]
MNAINNTNLLSRDTLALSRREVLAGGGAVIVSFSLSPVHAQAPQPQSPPLPGSLKETPLLDSWIRIDADGSITVFTGKAELGQGIKTALLQVAAEELGAGIERITLVTADTARTPNEGYTSGSHSMPDSATAIRNAAAQVRDILLARAAERLSTEIDHVKLRDGTVRADDGKSIGVGELVGDDVLHVQAQPTSKLTDPANYTLIGKPVARVDIPAKVTGGVAYVHDLRLTDMVHARVVRPPGYGANLLEVDVGKVEALPGVLKVVRDGSFLGIVAEREYQAITAMRALAQAARWSETSALPDPASIYTYLQGLPARDVTILDRGTLADASNVLTATYHRPYQMHGAIGPACAVALFADDALTVWSHAQGMFPLRRAVAELVGLAPEKVRCIHIEGSGCYGHNGADDAAGDAALLARAIPGRPVRVQWMREQEHTWEPFGPAMAARISAALDRGKITSWQYDVWSNSHSTRPGTAGSLLAGLAVAKPFPEPPPALIPQPEGGGDRNAIPIYTIPNARVVNHFIPGMPLRVSAMRALGAYANVFAIESFMDELAKAAGADPVEFRLRHLDDARARDAVTLAAEKFGWQSGTTPGRGRGFAFARYKNLAAYCAVAVEVSVEHETGEVRLRRAVAAVDSGEAVNPDGIRNQVEGGLIQAASWTLYEQVGFNTQRLTSRDWSGYPIMRFPAVPESVEVHVINRPAQPFLGTGEASAGPAAAAIANAIADATGARIRDLPFRRQRVKAAIGV